MLLAGCSLFGIAGNEPAGGDPPPPPQVSAAGQPDAACWKSAAEHAADVSNQGFDADVQQRVFDDSYRACLDWKRRT
jgi:hypothetical protein